MRKPNALLLVLLAVSWMTADAFAFTSPTDARDLRFADPPASVRLLPIRHGRPDDLTRVESEVSELLSLGYGGLVVNAPFGSGYLTTTNGWDTFRRVIRRCREKGLSLWLYDEDGYPSGSARDLVLRDHPQWEASGILVASVDGAGGETVRLTLPPGRHMRTFVCPMSGDKPDCAHGRFISASPLDGVISVAFPGTSDERWRAMAVTVGTVYEGSHASINIARKAKYPNLLLKEVGAQFVAVTHDTYANRLGDDLQAFEATFTDEPSLMTFWFSSMPYVPLPWSEDLAMAYEKASGCALLDDVPYLAFTDVGGDSLVRRHRFWKLVADRVSGNYFGQIRDWCRRHGLRSGGHLLWEEAVSAHVGLYGDFFRCLRTLDEPGMDCLTSLPDKVPWRTARFAGSAAALNGARRVMCEVSDHVQRWRAQGDKTPIRYVTEDEVVGTLNRLVWGGVNVFTSYYVFDRLDAAAQKRINLSVGRLATLMSEGFDASDVAVLYPSDTLMATYEPSRHYGGGGANAAVAASFCAASEALYAAGRPFVFVDSQTLARASVETDGTLSSGALRWRAVVLPRATVLSPTVLERLVAFRDAGGLVVAVDETPRSSVSARQLSDRLFEAKAKGRGLGVVLKSDDLSRLAVLLARRQPLPSAAPDGDGTATPLLWAHRRTDVDDIWLALNRSNEVWRGTVTFRKDTASVRVYDPRKGTVEETSSSSIDVTLSPGGVVVLTGAGLKGVLHGQ